MNNNYITISELNRYLKTKFENDVNLKVVYLKGEISNFKAHTRGHYYFTLKDDGSRINAIMFASQTKKIKFVPQDGMKVLVTGKISVFEANGGYQIYVNEMLEDGVGNLYIAYEQLKKKLENEGLFNKDHKKEIPHIPKRVGVVTAPTGAAIKDIISTIKRRWPLTEIYLFPSLVQGEDAKEDIVKQIKKAENFYLPLDTLIVGRGGGSIEDLWPFNEEIVARAIYECKVPTISAVGHEIDFTIADFVADLRAPTPTGAAEMAVPQLSDMKNYLNQVNIRLNNTITNKINNNKRKLNDIMARNIFKNPMIIYEKKELYFDSILERLKFSLKSLTSAKEKELIKFNQETFIPNFREYIKDYIENSDSIGTSSQDIFILNMIADAKAAFSEIAYIEYYGFNIYDHMAQKIVGPSIEEYIDSYIPEFINIKTAYTSDGVAYPDINVTILSD